MSEHDDNNATSPPAYFLSVSLENVRCFGPKQTLDLSDGEGRPAQWTVILGDNGTGKTTLLQAIALLEPVEEILVSNQKKVVLGLTSRFRSSNYRQDLKKKDLQLPTAFRSQLSLRRKLTGSDSEHHYIWVEESTQHEVRVAEAGYLMEPIGGLKCYAYGASRRMGDSGLGGSGDAEVDEVESLFYDDVELPNGEDWLLQIDYAESRAKAGGQKAPKDRRAQVTEVLVQLLPDVDEIRFVEPEEGKLVPRVEFKTPYGWVRIGQLSLGYRTMIAWTVDVARRMFQRYPDSPNPLSEPAVVLVDEIDLHLHPRWQRDIIPFLSERFPNTQFIVTAHSPLIVQAAQDANIAVLRREGDHVVIEQDLKPLRNLRVDQILTSDLYGLESARPPHLDELLEQRRTLLSQSSLTEGDRRRLKEIEEEIGDLPAGETPEEMEAMDIIRQAAERLKEDA